MSVGRLLGTARRRAFRAPMGAVSKAPVALEHRVAADPRSRARPGRSTRRQVSILRVEDRQTIEAELGTGLVWTTYRANLLVGRLRLPRRAGDYPDIGSDVRLEIAGESDPCRRIDEQHQGLMAARLPGRRGGDIAIGDEVRI